MLLLFLDTIPFIRLRATELEIFSETRFNFSLLPLFHTGPESHELTRINKYLDS